MMMDKKAEIKNLTSALKELQRPKKILKSYRLTKGAINLLDKLVDRFSTSAGFKISDAKIIEMALYEIRNKELKNLID
jgi:hypothetical protein